MNYYKDGDFRIKTDISFGNYSHVDYFTGSWEANGTHLSLQYHENDLGCLIGIFMEATLIEEYELSEITKNKLVLNSTNQSEDVWIAAKNK